MTPLLVAILGPVATVAVALLGYFGFRALRQAQTRKTDAESELAGATADKTTQRRGRCYGRVTATEALEDENAALRSPSRTPKRRPARAGRVKSYADA